MEVEGVLCQVDSTSPIGSFMYYSTGTSRHRTRTLNFHAVNTRISRNDKTSHHDGPLHYLISSGERVFILSHVDLTKLNVVSVDVLIERKISNGTAVQSINFVIKNSYVADYLLLEKWKGNRVDSISSVKPPSSLYGIVESLHKFDNKNELPEKVCVFFNNQKIRVFVCKDSVKVNHSKLDTHSLPANYFKVGHAVQVSNLRPCVKSNLMKFCTYIASMNINIRELFNPRREALGGRGFDALPLLSRYSGTIQTLHYDAVIPLPKTVLITIDNRSALVFMRKTELFLNNVPFRVEGLSALPHGYFKVGNTVEVINLLLCNSDGCNFLGAINLDPSLVSARCSKVSVTIDESHLSQSEEGRTDTLHENLNRVPQISNGSDTLDKIKHEEQLSELLNDLLDGSFDFPSVSLKQETLSPRRRNEEAVASSTFNNVVNQSPAQLQDTRTTEVLNVPSVAINHESKYVPTAEIASISVKQEIQSPQQNEESTKIIGLALSVQVENNSSKRNCDDRPNSGKLEGVIGRLDGTCTNGLVMYFCTKLKGVCTKPFRIVKTFISQDDSDISRYCGSLSKILYDGMRVLLISHGYISETKEVSVEMTVKLNADETPIIMFHVRTKEVAENSSLKEEGALNRLEYNNKQKSSAVYGIIDSLQPYPMHILPKTVSCFKDGDVICLQDIDRRQICLNGRNLVPCEVLPEHFYVCGGIVEVSNIILKLSGYRAKIRSSIDCNTSKKICFLERPTLVGVIEELTQTEGKLKVMVPLAVSVYINNVKRRVHIGRNQILSDGWTISHNKLKILNLSKNWCKVGNAVVVKNICQFVKLDGFDYSGQIEVDQKFFDSLKQPYCNSGSPCRPIIQGKVDNKFLAIFDKQKTTPVEENVRGTIETVKLFHDVHLPERVCICLNNVVKMVNIHKRHVFLSRPSRAIRNSEIKMLHKNYFKVGDSIVLKRIWNWGKKMGCDYSGVVEIDPDSLDSLKEPNCNSQPSQRVDHSTVDTKVSTIRESKNLTETTVLNEQDKKLIGVIESVIFKKEIGIYLPVDVLISINNSMKRVHITRGDVMLNNTTIKNSQLQKIPSEYFKVGDSIEVSTVHRFTRDKPEGYEKYTGVIKIDPNLLDPLKEPYCNPQPSHHESQGTENAEVSTASRLSDQKETIVSNEQEEKHIGVIETIRFHKRLRMHLPTEVRICINNNMKRVHIARSDILLNNLRINNSKLRQIPTNYFEVGDTIELIKLSTCGVLGGYDLSGFIEIDPILCDTLNKPSCSNSKSSPTNSPAVSRETLTTTVSSTYLPTQVSRDNNFVRDYESHNHCKEPPPFVSPWVTQTHSVFNSTVQLPTPAGLASNIHSGVYMHQESQHLSQNVPWNTLAFSNINTFSHSLNILAVGSSAASQLPNDVLPQPWNANNYSRCEENTRPEEHQTSHQAWNTADSVYSLPDIQQRDNQCHQTMNDKSDFQLSTRYPHYDSGVSQEPERSWNYCPDDTRVPEPLQEDNQEAHLMHAENFSDDDAGEEREMSYAGCEDYTDISEIEHENGIAAGVSRVIKNRLGRQSVFSRLGGKVMKREQEVYCDSSLPDNSRDPYSCFTGVVVRATETSGIAQFELDGALEQARFYRSDTTQDGKPYSWCLADLIPGTEVILRDVQAIQHNNEQKRGIFYRAQAEIQDNKKRKSTSEADGGLSAKRSRSHEENGYYHDIRDVERRSRVTTGHRMELQSYPDRAGYNTQPRADKRPSQATAECPVPTRRYCQTNEARQDRTL